MKKTNKAPRANKKRQYKEHAHQAAIFELAALYERQYPLLALLQGSMVGVDLDIFKAKRAKAAGVKAGFPDINLPVARGGYLGLYIELKTEKGRVSPDQDRIMSLLTSQGHLVALLKGQSAQSVFKAIIDYLAGKIRRPQPPEEKKEKPDEPQKTQLHENRSAEPLPPSPGEAGSGPGPGV